MGLNWKKTGRRTWDVMWGTTLLGHVRREYRIGRGRRFYSIWNLDNHGLHVNETSLAGAARHLALMQSSLVIRAQP